MSQIQIAMSGVTAGTYGNSKQIPTFSVDARGRITWAADVNIEPNLQILVDDDPRQKKTLNLNIDTVRFQSGEGVSVKMINEGILEFSLDKNTIDEILDNSSFTKVFTGKVKGLNGTTYVDTTTNVLSNGILTFDENYIRGSFIELGDESAYDRATVRIISSSETPSLEITAASSGFSCANIDLTSYKNSFHNQETLQNNDSLGQIRFNGFIKTPAGNDTANLALINSSLTQESDGVSTLPHVKIDFICMNGPDVTKAKIASFDNKGTLSAPILKTGIYSDTVSRDSSIPSPEVGMIIFISSTGKFQGNIDGTVNGWNDLN